MRRAGDERAATISRSHDYNSCETFTEGGATGRYAYTAREWDPEVGLYYYRARYYDPKVGRFVSEDPLSFRLGTNLFAYASNEPLGHADPTGLVPASSAASGCGCHGTRVECHRARRQAPSCFT